MKRQTFLSSALLLLLFLAAPTVHALAPQPGPSAANTVDDDAAYAQGTQAMNEHHWPDAVTSFDKVINSRDKKADAALYWKAYSLVKLGDGSSAIATCARLRVLYPSSRWNNDCAALSIDMKIEARAGMPIPPVPPVPPMDFDFDFEGPGAPHHASNEDLKVLALNSLLNQDPARAIPELRGVLTGNQPVSVKKHALFILAQSKSPEAQSILHDAVTGKMDPALQRQAIQMMAVFQGKRANETLVEVYRTTSDPKIKNSIITSLFITQDAPHLVELARNEKDLDLKRIIVSRLAIMHDKAATDYMVELLK